MRKVGNTREINPGDNFNEILNMVEYFHDWTIHGIHFNNSRNNDISISNFIMIFSDGYNRAIHHYVKIDFINVIDISIRNITSIPSEIDGINIFKDASLLLFTSMDKETIAIKSELLRFSFFNNRF